MNRVITIGREFGSGGRTIANKTGELLGIPVFDHEILLKIAEESGFSASYIEERAENTTLSHLISRSLSGLGGYSTTSAEDYMWQYQGKVICDLAEKESCIIVGRCSDYILKGKADLLNVFIYADKESRAHRIINVYGEVPDKDAYSRLKEKDKRRSNFYNYHTDLKWGDPHNYNICLDAGALGIDECAEVIASLY